MQKISPSLLTDDQLLVEVKALAAGERDATAQLIASLAELDARRLYLGEGCSSLFAYCTRVLHQSEHAAYNRIEAARAARTWPVILDLLADGSLTLTTACLLAPHLTDDNHREVLAGARQKSKREVEQMVAALHPRPDVAATIRKLPAPTSLPATDRRPIAPPASAPAGLAGLPAVGSVCAPLVEMAAAPVTALLPTPPRPAVVVPLAPGRYKVQVTVSRQTHDKLRRAQDLLRHAVPNGDPAEILDRALTLLVEHLERTKLASAIRTRAPRGQATKSRHIPSSVKRAVWVRDGGRCAFYGTEGRCDERGFVEFHHVIPYADGGLATIDQIQLRCRTHNQYEAEGWSDQSLFGNGHARSRETRPTDRP